MDYKQFREQRNLSPRDMVEVIRAECPKYGKGQQSMIEHPDRYGMCLLPAIDKILLEHFGGTAPKKQTPNRKKKNRFQVWLDDDTAKKLIAIRARVVITTQRLLQDMIENMVALSEIN